MMEESQESFKAQPVTVTVLLESAAFHPDEAASVNPRFQATVERIDQPFMELRSSEQVAVGAAVKIETRDALWLGDAESCVSTDGDWTILIHLRHVLRDFETLARLAERFGLPPKGIPVRA